jgi:hypothetical protein
MGVIKQNSENDNHWERFNNPFQNETMTTLD